MPRGVLGNMPLNEQLINAIRNSDNIKVSNLLDIMDVSAVNEMTGNRKLTALHAACVLRSDQALILLLAKPGIDVNVQNSFGSTPLHNACKWKPNDQAVSKLLAKPGIDVNVQNNLGFTPLHIACQENEDQSAARLMATPGINVNRRANNGWTPVMAATGRHSLKTFKLLLQDPRVDLDIKDNEGRGLEEAVGRWDGIQNDTKYDLIKEERMKRGNVQPARPETPHPTLASNSRKRSRVESEDDNDNLSPFKVQGVDRLDASKQCLTPVKFRGKTEEKIEEKGDNDKLEYTLHMSMKSVPATTKNNIEDRNLAAAIKASQEESTDIVIEKIERINKKIEDSKQSWEEVLEKQKLEKEEVLQKQKLERETLVRKHQEEKTHQQETFTREAETNKQHMADLTEVRNELVRDLEKIHFDKGKSNAANNNDDKLKAARRALECPICLESMKPPKKIWMCPRSHAICEACKILLEEKPCPTCTSGRVNMRAYTTEKMAEIVFDQSEV